MNTNTEQASDLDLLAMALTYAFREPVTAFLTNAQIVGSFCLGVCHRHVRADALGQFLDGHRIRTSPIVSAFQDGPYWCICTYSDSVYVILSFSTEDSET